MPSSQRPETLSEFRAHQAASFLKPLTGVSLLVSIVLSLAHIVLLRSTEFLVRDLLVISVLAIVFGLSVKDLIKPGYFAPVNLLLGLTLGGVAIAEELTVGQQQLTHYYQIIYVVAGITFLKPQWLGIYYGSSFTMWWFYAANFMDPVIAREQAMTLLMALVCGVGCHIVRRRQILYLFSLKKVESENQTQLREALHEGQLAREKLRVEEAIEKDEIAQLQTELEALLRDRCELEQDLMHSQAMDSLGRLAGGLAHELNNSLTVVSGLLDLNAAALKEQPFGRELLAELKETLGRGGELAGRLVTVSGNLILKKQPISVSQVISNLKKLLGSHRLEMIDFDLPSELDDIILDLDEGAWLQTLQNLVGNAWDATDGQERVDVIVRKRGHKVEFEIRDRGPGVSAENRSKIFEPYFTTKERGSGTGLGLAISAGVVEKHGGQLELVESGSEGSIFRATLPALATKKPTQERKLNPSQLNENGVAKVLFVEDEMAILKVAKRHLSKLGFEVTATTNPHEALDFLDSEPYDIVVSDVVMPELDGPGMIEKARRKKPDLKVIFVSGYTDDRLRNAGVSPNSHVFLKKPYSIPDLADLIRETVRS